jgi:hypothetical protein
MTTAAAGTNFGDIICPFYNPYKLSYVYQCLFRSNTLERFLRYKTCALITQRFLIADLEKILKSRTVIIREEFLHLFREEKEFNNFIITYITTA